MEGRKGEGRGGLGMGVNGREGRQGQEKEREGNECGE